MACVDRTRAEAPRYFDNKHNYTRSGQEGNAALDGGIGYGQIFYMNTPPNNPVDLYFMDARSKLIDIAAFMDRVQRSGETDDYRYQMFLKALQGLDSTNRAEAVLGIFSDMTVDPTQVATPGPASGAWKEEA